MDLPPKIAIINRSNRNNFLKDPLSVIYVAKFIESIPHKPSDNISTDSEVGDFPLAFR